MPAQPMRPQYEQPYRPPVVAAPVRVPRWKKLVALNLKQRLYGPDALTPEEQSTLRTKSVKRFLRRSARTGAKLANRHRMIEGGRCDGNRA